MQRTTISGTKENYLALVDMLIDNLINAKENLNNIYVKDLSLCIEHDYHNWVESTYTIKIVKPR
jgi:predicted transcriptional regulator